MNGRGSMIKQCDLMCHKCGGLNVRVLREINDIADVVCNDCDEFLCKIKFQSEDEAEQCTAR